MAELRDLEMYHRIYSSRRFPIHYKALYKSQGSYDGSWREPLHSKDSRLAFQSLATQRRVLHAHTYEEDYDGIFDLEL
jgi:hypothetical protein